MKVEFSFDTELKVEQVKDIVIQYFTHAGYEMRQAEGAFVFTRGSLWGSLTSFSPKKWRVSLDVRIISADLRHTEVLITGDINTTGQVVTPSEASFWDAELMGVKDVVDKGEFVPGEGIKAPKVTLLSSLKVVGSPLLSGLFAGLLEVVVLVPSVFLARFFTPMIVDLLNSFKFSMREERFYLLSVLVFWGVSALFMFFTLRSQTDGFAQVYLDGIPQWLTSVLKIAMLNILVGIFLSYSVVFIHIIEKSDLWHMIVTFVGLVAIAFALEREMKQSRQV